MAPLVSLVADVERRVVLVAKGARVLGEQQRREVLEPAATESLLICPFQMGDICDGVFVAAGAICLAFVGESW